MFRKRTYALIGAAAVAGVLVAVLPAFGTSHEVPDAVLFDARDGSPSFTYNGAEQTLDLPKNSCAFTTDSSLINVSTPEGQGAPGIASASMGVKSRGANANGTPCSQVDVNETLIFTLGSTLADRTFTKLVLDVEMTGDAVVEVVIDDDTSDPFLLQTGNSITICAPYLANPVTVIPPPGCDTLNDTPPFDVTTTSTARTGACQTANSSGSNNAANDNCIWTIDPGENFKSFTLSVVGIGTVSLEGGAETGTASEFHLGPAVLECGDTATITKLGVTATYEYIDDGEVCDKSYLLDIVKTGEGTPTVLFQPQLENAVDCSRLASGEFPDGCDEEFKASVAFGPEGKVNGPETGALEYAPDPEDETAFKPMQWCTFDPFEVDPSDPDSDAMPIGESWCIVEVTTVIDSATKTSTTWTLYGIGDPLKRLS